MSSIGWQVIRDSEDIQVDGLHSLDVPTFDLPMLLWRATLDGDSRILCFGIGGEIKRRTEGVGDCRYGVVRSHGQSPTRRHARGSACWRDGMTGWTWLRPDVCVR